MWFLTLLFGGEGWIREGTFYREIKKLESIWHFWGMFSQAGAKDK